MRIGIDLGGTKIEIIVLDEQRKECYRKRIASPRDDYAATLDALSTMVKEAEQEMGRTCSVGVGIPGTISSTTGLVKNANSTWLIGRPLQADLENRLARPVRIANDANCFTVSEAVDGAGQGSRVVFGVIIGTGTGGGVVVDGRCLSGVNGIAGEWGHNPLPWAQDDERPGPECYCGKRACIETYLSGPGLSRDFYELSGLRCEATAIVKMAADHHTQAGIVLQRYEDRMARALASVINIIDPDVIVLGGGMSNIDRLYKTVPTLLPKYVFSDEVNTVLRPPQHGDSSGVRGAAWLWPE